MPILTIRNIETEIKDKLRMAAAANGRLHARFVAIGGADMSVPERTEPACAADFGNSASRAGL